MHNSGLARRHWICHVASLFAPFGPTWVHTIGRTAWMVGTAAALKCTARNCEASEMRTSQEMPRGSHA
jgi:hypothetical protein